VHGCRFDPIGPAVMPGQFVFRAAVAQELPAPLPVDFEPEQTRRDATAPMLGPKTPDKSQPGSFIVPEATSVRGNAY
jgi:hypothetical protein